MPKKKKNLYTLLHTPQISSRFIYRLYSMIISGQMTPDTVVLVQHYLVGLPYNSHKGIFIGFHTAIKGSVGMCSGVKYYLRPYVCIIKTTGHQRHWRTEFLLHTSSRLFTIFLHVQQVVLYDKWWKDAQTALRWIILSVALSNTTQLLLLLNDGC